LLAGVLSALCLWFAWRAYRRTSTIQRGALQSGREAGHSEEDALELRLAEKELNLELSLAARTVKALGRAALFGGTGLAIASIASGAYRTEPRAALGAFALGLVGWGGCRELERRIGLLADSWRSETNQRRKRQGVDQPKRTE
jgi:hypothetical protein